MILVAMIHQWLITALEIDLVVLGAVASLFGILLLVKIFLQIIKLMKKEDKSEE